MGKRFTVVAGKVLDRRQTDERGNRRVVTYELTLEDGRKVTRSVSMRGNEGYTETGWPRYVVDESAGSREPARLKKPELHVNANYERTLDAHRRNLAKIVEDRGVDRIKRLYDKAQDELNAKLRRITPARRDTFTAYQHRIVLAQVQQAQTQIARKLAGEAGAVSREAQVESLRGLTDQIGKLEKTYTGADIVLPIDEAARFYGVVDQRRTSLLKQHEESMASYGARVVGKVEEQLALSLATGETADAAIDRVQQTTDREWWQAERIVRTETAWAFNATHADGVAELASEIPDIYMRWVEHVTDDGEPMDNRVGADSIAMHGQIIRPGGMFVMPPDPEVSTSMWGQRWAFPPNRPNDRAVLSSWRPHWGGLAWEWKGGRRIDR
jgi:hypothetical protein